MSRNLEQVDRMLMVLSKALAAETRKKQQVYILKRIDHYLDLRNDLGGENERTTESSVRPQAVR